MKLLFFFISVELQAGQKQQSFKKFILSKVSVFVNDVCIPATFLLFNLILLIKIVPE